MCSGVWRVTGIPSLGSAPCSSNALRITGLAPCSSRRQRTGRRRESTRPLTDLGVIGTAWSRRWPANVSNTVTSSPAHTATKRAAFEIAASDGLTLFLLWRCDDDDNDDAASGLTSGPWSSLSWLYDVRDLIAVAGRLSRSRGVPGRSVMAKLRVVRGAADVVDLGRRCPAVMTAAELPIISVFAIALYRHPRSSDIIGH